MNKNKYIVAGGTLFLVNVLVTAIWTKNYSSKKLLYESPEFVALIFSIGCFISAFLFIRAIRNKGHKIYLLPITVLCIVAGLSGLAVAIFIRGFKDWPSY